jgi:SAM-dependent methyltransferase
MLKYTCEICGNKNKNLSFIAKEMMFGSKDKFDYFECSHCGTLQIAKIPENISHYYPDDYYSFKGAPFGSEGRLKSFLKKQLARFILSQKSPLINLVPQVYRSDDLFSCIRKARLNFNSKILDVGCGAGSMLLRLSEYGYKNIMGADPFIEKNIYYPNGVKILKRNLEQLKGRYDLIILRHSFEHMAKPENVFKNLFRLLKPDRYVVLMIPVVAYAWIKYGLNWVQLDAPRHFFIHTIKGIKILARRTGFEVKKIIYDSTDFQFWGSEQYLKGISLFDPRSYGVNAKKSIFSIKEIGRFKQKANELNKKKDGDMVTIYLYKTNLGQ